MMKIVQNIPRDSQPVFSITEIPVVQGGTSSPSSPVGPVEVDAVTGSTSWNNHVINSPLDTVTITNGSPTNMTITGTLIEMAAGLGGSVFVRGANRIGTWNHIDFAYQGSGTSYVPSGFVSGAHPAHAWAIIQPLLDAGGAVPLFSAVNHSTQTYTKNASCWAAGWDFSGVSVWNSRMNDFRRAGTMVTRRHMVGVSHYRLEVGDKVRFRGSSGTVFEYTVLAITPPPLSSVSTTDYNVFDTYVAVLDRDVDASIKSYPVAGQWILNVGSIPSENPPMDPDSPSWPLNSSEPDIFWGYWIGGTNQPALCGIHLNQNRNAYVFAIASTQAAGARSTRTQADFHGNTINRSIQWVNLLNGPFASPLPDFMSSYSTTYCPSWAVSGDSGSPTFFPISSTELALICCQTDQVGGMSLEESMMNAIISATDAAAGISTGYTVTVAPDPTL